MEDLKKVRFLGYLFARMEQKIYKEKHLKSLLASRCRKNWTESFLPASWTAKEKELIIQRSRSLKATICKIFHQTNVWYWHRKRHSLLSLKLEYGHTELTKLNILMTYQHSREIILRTDIDQQSHFLYQVFSIATVILFNENKILSLNIK